MPLVVLFCPLVVLFYQMSNDLMVYWYFVVSLQAAPNSSFGQAVLKFSQSNQIGRDWRWSQRHTSGKRNSCWLFPSSETWRSYFYGCNLARLQTSFFVFVDFLMGAHCFDRCFGRGSVRYLYIVLRVTEAALCQPLWVIFPAPILEIAGISLHTLGARVTGKERGRWEGKLPFPLPSIFCDSATLMT